MYIKSFMLSFLALMFTSACSGTYHAYYQTLKIAFSSRETAKMTIAQVKESKIDLIEVKRGKRPKAIMALAYLENDQHKWISNDKVMLIMEKGRIVRTLGLSENLLFVSNTDEDPLKLFHTSNLRHNTWYRTIDLTNDQYSYPIESKLEQVTQTVLQEFNIDIKTHLYIENLKYSAPANYLQLNDSWKNYYWYSQSGKLIKSIQKITPLSESFEITYVSRISRLEN